MKEYIGICVKCNKEVYCKNGFLDGVHEQGHLYCFTCAGEQSTEHKYNQKKLFFSVPPEYAFLSHLI